MSLTFTDSGVPYNPLEADPPVLSKPLAERAAGGLGIFLVKKLMDTVTYRRDGDQNVLVLSKHLLQEAPNP